MPYALYLPNKYGKDNQVYTIRERVLGYGVGDDFSDEETDWSLYTLVKNVVTAPFKFVAFVILGTARACVGYIHGISYREDDPIPPPLFDFSDGSGICPTHEGRQDFEDRPLSLPVISNDYVQIAPPPMLTMPAYNQPVSYSQTSYETSQNYRAQPVYSELTSLMPAGTYYNAYTTQVTPLPYV